MHAKLLAVYAGCDRHQVKHFHNVIINFYIMPVRQALFAEVERLSHLSRFVVSPQKDNTFRVPQLHCNQVADNFGAVGTPVNVVAKEDPIDLVWLFNFIELSNQVVELSVHVTKYIGSTLYAQQIRFLVELGIRDNFNFCTSNTYFPRFTSSIINSFEIRPNSSMYYFTRATLGFEKRFPLCLTGNTRSKDSDFLGGRGTSLILRSPSGSYSRSSSLISGLSFISLPSDSIPKQVQLLILLRFIADPEIMLRSYSVVSSPGLESS